MNSSLEPTVLESLIRWAQVHPEWAAGAAFLLPLVIFLIHQLVVRPAVPAAPEPPLAPGPAPRAEGAPPPPPTPEPIPEVFAEPEAAAEPLPEVIAEPEAAAEPIPEVFAEPEEIAEPLPEVTAEPEESDEAEETAKPVPKKPVLAERLARTGDTLVGRIGRLLGGRRLEPELLEELEATLFTADLGVATAESLLERVRKEAAGREAETVRDVLRGAILAKLQHVECAPGSHFETRQTPHVIVVLGVNGSGKTTTIGKLAARYAALGKRVILGAGDTFRAAAIEQLEVWAGRVGCEVVKGSQGSDPAAVAYDTVQAARARGADVAIVDTAGRLQTRLPLVEQLKKLIRVVGKDLAGAPHETLLVLDANTGQNAISQARVFLEAAGVTGLVLTKLDGTAKGGVIVGLADELGIPIKFVGVGEKVEDLREFDAQEFVDALFSA